MIGTAANIPCRPRRTATGTPDVAEAYIGDQYRYLLTTAKSELKRIDPYVREATSSVGNAWSTTGASTGLRYYLKSERREEK